MRASLDEHILVCIAPFLHYRVYRTHYYSTYLQRRASGQTFAAGTTYDPTLAICPEPQPSMAQQLHLPLEKLDGNLGQRDTVSQIRSSGALESSIPCLQSQLHHDIDLSYDYNLARRSSDYSLPKSLEVRADFDNSLGQQIGEGHEACCMNTLLNLANEQHFRDLINRFAYAVYPTILIPDMATIWSIYESTRSQTFYDYISRFIIPNHDSPPPNISNVSCLDANENKGDGIAALLAVYGLAGLSLTEWDPLWSSLRKTSGRRDFALAMLELIDEYLRQGENTSISQIRVCALYLTVILEIQLFGISMFNLLYPLHAYISSR